jgi:PilZ domain
MKIRPRMHDRVSHLREVVFRLDSGGTSARGRTIDLSLNGVRLFCEQSLTVGETLELIWPDLDPPVSVGGQVVYVQFDVDGAFAGIRFFRPIAPEVLQVLLAPRRRSTAG